MDYIKYLPRDIAQIVDEYADHKCQHIMDTTLLRYQIEFYGDYLTEPECCRSCFYDGRQKISCFLKDKEIDYTKLYKLIDMKKLHQNIWWLTDGAVCTYRDILDELNDSVSYRLAHGEIERAVYTLDSYLKYVLNPIKKCTDCGENWHGCDCYQ